MAKKKVGPRRTMVLQCTECKKINYVSEYNKNNETLKKQAGEGTFPLSKFCNTCRSHTSHKMREKMK